MSTSSARVEATRAGLAGAGARSCRARRSRRTERRATEDERSARVVDLFEASSTPMAAAARAAAAAAALKAMTNAREVSSGSSDGIGRGGAANVVASAGTASASARVIASGPSSAEPSSVVARKDDGSKSETEKTSNPKAETFNPGSDFWTWTPPEVPAADKAPGEPTPKLQKQTQTRVSAAVAIAERPLEQALHLKFQSDTETPSELSLDFESDAEVKNEATAKTGTLTVELEETATAVRELGADGATQGTLANGSRWWRESGEEELEGGKLCRWTLVRGASADGSVEWEEKMVGDERRVQSSRAWRHKIWKRR